MGIHLVNAKQIDSCSSGLIRSGAELEIVTQRVGTHVRGLAFVEQEISQSERISDSARPRAGRPLASGDGLLRHKAAAKRRQRSQYSSDKCCAQRSSVSALIS